MVQTVIVLFLVSTSVLAQQSELKINFIANEGFLIKSGETKIIIDGLFKLDSTNHYSCPSTETIQDIIDGRTPFENVNYLLVTHDHGDHFSWKLVSEFLNKNKQAKLICGTDVEKKLADSSKVYNDFKSRIIASEPDKNSSVDVVQNENVFIKAMRTRHVPYKILDEESGELVDKHRKKLCFTYFVNLNGRKIIHAGDALVLMHRKLFAEIENEKPDVLFLEYFDTSVHTEEVIKSVVKPDHLIFMHLDKPRQKDADFFPELKKIFPTLIDIYKNGNEIIL